MQVFLSGLIFFGGKRILLEHVNCGLNDISTCVCTFLCLADNQIIYDKRIGCILLSQISTMSSGILETSVLQDLPIHDTKCVIRTNQLQTLPQQVWPTQHGFVNSDIHNNFRPVRIYHLHVSFANPISRGCLPTSENGLQEEGLAIDEYLSFAGCFWQ